MVARPPTGKLVPLGSAPDDAVRLAVAAVQYACARESPPQDPTPVIAWVSERIRAGTVEGRLYRVRDRPVGVAMWEGNPELGLHLRTLYLDEGYRSVEAYADFLEKVGVEAGPVAFLTAALPNLSPEEVERLAGGHGFARYGRSEMRFPVDTAVPDQPPPAGVTVRPVRLDDEPSVAAAHAAAFGRHFDFYLFRGDLDPERSSLLEVHDILTGRWGEFLPWASFLAEGENHHVMGGCLFVRAPYGPLLVSLFVDPAAQGKGVGRTLTAESLRALRARGESVIALNVTEGNRRAVATYEKFGFVRSLGPGWEWYSTELVPVAPDGSPSRPPVTAPLTGSRAPAGPRNRPA